MTMFDSKLILVLLVAIAPSYCSNVTLEEELEKLLQQLQNATDDYECIISVSGGQCPCLTSDGICLVGNETIDDVECFANKLQVLSNILHDLIADLTNLTSDRPADCPILDGCAALVSGCESSGIAVVDGAEMILPDIVASANVSGLTVSDDDDCYTLYYLSDGLAIVTALYENGTESNVYNGSAISATGIAYCGGSLYLAIQGSIRSVDIATGSDADIVVLTGDPGTVRIYNNRVYYSDGENIYSSNKTGGDAQSELKFPMQHTSFDVLDEGRIVFGDAAGGLWVYNKTSECFKLLECRSGVVSGDIKVNPCFDQFYVVYVDNADLSRYNSSTCVQDEDLTYTESSALSCPRLAFEPNWYVNNCCDKLFAYCGYTAPDQPIGIYSLNSIR